jgi:hypothetical protein
VGRVGAAAFVGAPSTTRDPQTSETQKRRPSGKSQENGAETTSDVTLPSEAPSSRA